jgi:hypothetical protein
MEDLILEPTKSSPTVRFSVTSGVWELSGKSCPENVFAFYDPIFKWIKSFIAEVNGPILFNVRLTYFNTSSSKTLLDLFEIFSEYHKSGGKIEVNWYYEEDDEDMLESGEEFSEDVDLPFNFVMVD